MTGGVITIFVSLAEPVMVLKGLLQDYSAVKIQAAMSAGKDIGALAQLRNYDCSAYMTALVHEIFHASSYSASLDNRPPASTQVLLSAGVEPQEAISMSIQVFQVCLDAITAALPDLPFGQLDGLIYDFSGTFDLMISLHKSVLPQ